jgi:hypothetical protein
MLKWKNILSEAQLLRNTRKWCATCYEESIREEKPAKAIVTRHLYYQTSSRKEKAHRLRDAIREAVKQLMASGLNVSEARVRAYVIQQLPGLGNGLLFKRALREIKAKMNMTN